MAVWIIGALLIGAVAFWWFGKQPVTHRRIPLSGLHRFVASLPAQMASGGFFIADRESGPGFLQLALSNYGQMQCTLEFGLPELDWSKERFEAVTSALKAAHYDPVVEPGQGAVSRFLRVIIAGPEENVIARSDQLLSLVSRELGWENRDTFRVRFGGSIEPGRALERLRARGA
jgi:hypothetical protein